jgi:hypothetical protein
MAVRAEPVLRQPLVGGIGHRSAREDAMEEAAARMVFDAPPGVVASGDRGRDLAAEGGVIEARLTILPLPRSRMCRPATRHPK